MRDQLLNKIIVILYEYRGKFECDMQRTLKLWV